MDGDDTEEEQSDDSWDCSGEMGVWRRKHVNGRRTLFTSSGTIGSPSRPSHLSGRRITEGVFLETGEDFIIVDSWKDKKDAHRKLEFQWTGTTTFEVDSSHQAKAGSAGIRVPGTDEALGPAADKDEQPQGEQAEPKPNQSTMRVRKSAGKIVEIKDQIEDEDDVVDIDELNTVWELIEAEGEKNDVDDPPLEGAEATSYRAVTARLNYVVPDRVDLQ